MLNRGGGLKTLSKPLSSHVRTGFALNDVVKVQLCRHIPDKIRNRSRAAFAVARPW